MNVDIYNPTEYWTTENLPNGFFTYDYGDGIPTETDADFVYNRINHLDRHNAVENFHALIHFGIAFESEYVLLGEVFKFNLIKE